MDLDLDLEVAELRSKVLELQEEESLVHELWAADVERLEKELSEARASAPAQEVFLELERVELALAHEIERNNILQEDKDRCEAAHARDVTSLEAMLQQVMSENARFAKETSRLASDLFAVTDSANRVSPVMSENERHEAARDDAGNLIGDVRGKALRMINDIKKRGGEMDRFTDNIQAWSDGNFKDVPKIHPYSPAVQDVLCKAFALEPEVEQTPQAQTPDFQADEEPEAEQPLPSFNLGPAEQQEPEAELSIRSLDVLGMGSLSASPSLAGFHFASA